MPFQPGHSGNPAGRPRGSRNKATIIAEQMLGDSAGEVTSAAIARALGGDGAALRACLDRVAPRLRHRPLDFDMPSLVTLADAPPAINAIAQGLAHGELDRDEAAALLRIVRAFMQALAEVARATRANRITVPANDREAREAERRVASPCPDARHQARRDPRNPRKAAEHAKPGPAAPPPAPMRRTRSGVISAMLRNPASAMSRLTSSLSSAIARCTPSCPAATAEYSIGRPSKQNLAPSASTLSTSVQRRMPPSNITVMSLASAAISGSTRSGETE